MRPLQGQRLNAYEKGRAHALPSIMSSLRDSPVAKHPLRDFLFAFNSLWDSPIAIFLPDTNDKNPFLPAPNIFYIVNISVQYQYSALHTRVFGLAYSSIRPQTLEYSARRLQYLRPKTATDHSTDGRGGCFGSQTYLN